MWMYLAERVRCRLLKWNGATLNLLFSCFLFAETFIGMWRGKVALPSQRIMGLTSTPLPQPWITPIVKEIINNENNLGKVTPCSSHDEKSCLFFKQFPRKGFLLYKWAGAKRPVLVAILLVPWSRPASIRSANSIKTIGKMIGFYIKSHIFWWICLFLIVDVRLQQWNKGSECIKT